MDREGFRERFKAYKNGKSISEIYDAGLPRYKDGTGDPNLVPFDWNRRIKLTNAGLATGAVLSESLLDAIADAAYRRGLPIKTALGLATKESTLGNPTDDTSVYKILSPEKVEKFKSLGTGTHINDAGDALFMKDVVNYHRSDDYPEDWNIFDRAFLFYKDEPHKYNPGLKNHPQLVDKRGEEVWGSPEILKWYKNWEANKIQVNRPEEYKINTNLLNTAVKPFFKNGKLPKYYSGKTIIGSNVDMRDDGTFTDNYTRAFDDVIITPEGPRVASGQLHKYQEPFDSYKFFNAITAGGLNNLSPAQWVGRLLDLYNGELTADSWFNGNYGVLPRWYAKDHPNQALATNALFDFWTLGGPSMIKNAGEYAKLATAGRDAANKFTFSFTPPEETFTSTPKELPQIRYIQPRKPAELKSPDFPDEPFDPSIDLDTGLHTYINESDSKNALSLIKGSGNVSGDYNASRFGVKQIESALNPTYKFKFSSDDPIEGYYNGPIPRTAITLGNMDVNPQLRMSDAGRLFGFLDPHAGLTTPSSGQETASPELVSTLYPKNKYTIQDVPSNIVRTYTEFPDPRTGNTSESIVNYLYDTYTKALDQYGKYKLNPPTPFIPSVGDDAVLIGFLNQFEKAARVGSEIEHAVNMPKGVNEKTAADMLSNWPIARLHILLNDMPLRISSNLLRRNGLVRNNDGLIIDPNIPDQSVILQRDSYSLLPTFDVHQDDVLDAFGVAPPLRYNMDIDEYDAYDNVRRLLTDRTLFRGYIFGFNNKLISNRYKRILSNAEDPNKYITDNFIKRIFKDAKEEYFSDIKKYKQRDYARRLKTAKDLNEKDTRFEIADLNRDRLNEAVQNFGKSYNSSSADASNLLNIVNNVSQYLQQLSKDWNTLKNSPNRPGWQIKSLMQGNALEKQLSKDGTISVSNILNHIKKGSDIEKHVVDKVLNEKFANKSKISYSDFKHAVLDELISYTQTPDSRYDTYGFNSLYGRRNSVWDSQNPIRVDDVKFDTYTFSSPKLPNGNSKHYSKNTLGHSRTFVYDNEPDVMYVMESQSDWALNFNNRSLIDEYTDGNIRAHERYLAKNFESRQIQENLLHASRKGLTKMRYPTPSTAAKIEGYERIRRPFKNGEQLNPADFNYYNPDTRNYDNYRYPEGIEIKEVYRPEHQTILNKYNEFPKKFKKLYKDAEVRTVTDNMGNSWYEVDVPNRINRKEIQYSKKSGARNVTTDEINTRVLNGWLEQHGLPQQEYLYGVKQAYDKLIIPRRAASFVEQQPTNGVNKIKKYLKDNLLDDIDFSTKEGLEIASENRWTFDEMKDWSDYKLYILDLLKYRSGSWTSYEENAWKKLYPADEDGSYVTGDYNKRTDKIRIGNEDALLHESRHRMDNFIPANKIEKNTLINAYGDIWKDSEDEIIPTNTELRDKLLNINHADNYSLDVQNYVLNNKNFVSDDMILDELKSINEYGRNAAKEIDKKEEALRQTAKRLGWNDEELKYRIEQMRHQYADAIRYAITTVGASAAVVTMKGHRE